MRQRTSVLLPEKKLNLAMPRAVQDDAIVIRASQGGRYLRIALARAEVVERGQIRGTRVDMAFTPTKTMVASARVAYTARSGADYGVRTAPGKYAPYKIEPPQVGALERLVIRKIQLLGSAGKVS